MPPPQPWVELRVALVDENRAVTGGQVFGDQLEDISCLHGWLGRHHLLQLPPGHDALPGARVDHEGLPAGEPNTTALVRVEGREGLFGLVRVAVDEHLEGTLWTQLLAAALEMVAEDLVARDQQILRGGPEGLWSLGARLDLTLPIGRGLL